MFGKCIGIMGALIMALTLGLAAPSARAQTTIGSTGNSQHVAIHDTQRPGQVFTPPTNTALTSFTVHLARSTPNLEVTPSIYEWTGSGTTGPPVWTGTPTLVTLLSVEPFTWTPNVVLDPAKSYIFWLDRPGGQNGVIAADAMDVSPDYYLAIYDGIGWVSYPTFETQFSATFAAPVAVVPTLSEWATILLALMLAGGATLVIQRRRAAV